LFGGFSPPPGLRVTDIDDDYIVGIHRDELDVEYVHVHRLLR
jgi:hypothetical protein